MRRRRAGREADVIESIFVAAQAAFQGKEAFQQMRRRTKDLRREAQGTGRGKRQGLADLAKQMGLSQK